MTIKFFYRLLVAVCAAFHATFRSVTTPYGVKIRLHNQTWRERYLYAYTLISLCRPHSWYMLHGPDSTSRWMPSGKNLILTTGCLGFTSAFPRLHWDEIPSETRPSFRRQPLETFERKPISTETAPVLVNCDGSVINIDSQNTKENND